MTWSKQNVLSPPTFFSEPEGTDHNLSNTIWRKYFIELDTFAHYFLSNLPLEQDIGLFADSGEQRRALRMLTEDAIFNFCADVCEEMYRRNNDLRDGFLALPVCTDASSLGRNSIRRKLHNLSAQSFHDLSIQLSFEIGRRGGQTRKGSKPQTENQVQMSDISSETVHSGEYRRSLLTGASYPRRLASLLDNLDYFPDDYYDVLDEAFPFQPRPDYFDETLSTIHSVFVAILQDKDRYNALLSYRGDAAQQILDLLQLLLDYPKVDGAFKNSLLLALSHLSGRSGLQPRCYILNGIKFDSSPRASGYFADIWKGDFQGRPVCLKIIKMYQNSSKERFLEAFSREAILWGHICHQNLVPFYGIYHLGDEHGRICLVSPWIDHGNINEYLLDVPNASRPKLVSDVAAGLLYLHERDIVHGDLKGANILVNKYGRACLSDFGLSKILNTVLATSESSDRSASVAGTIRWQAPELLDPSIQYPVANIASDVYAFGCVCYEIYTGRVPFYQYARDFTVVYHIIQGEKPTMPGRSNPAFRVHGLTDEMCAIMDSCWDIDPYRRPTVKQIILNLPLSDIADLWPVDNWEDRESASRFRNAAYRNDCLSSSVLETVLSWI